MLADRPVDPAHLPPIMDLPPNIVPISSYWTAPGKGRSHYSCDDICKDGDWPHFCDNTCLNDKYFDKYTFHKYKYEYTINKTFEDYACEVKSVNPENASQARCYPYYSEGGCPRSNTCIFINTSTSTSINTTLLKLFLYR